MERVAPAVGADVQCSGGGAAAVTSLSWSHPSARVTHGAGPFGLAGGSRRLRRGLAAFSAAIAPGAQARTPDIPPRCVFESPCVYYTPDVDPEAPPRGTVLTFYGRGWRPHAKIEALYGVFCPPRTACPAIGLIKTFRTNGAGRFVFRFRYGRRQPAGPGPKAAGGGELAFSGRGRRGRRVFDREAALPPPRSTPGQRSDARRIIRAARDLTRAIRRARPRTHRASDAYDREVRRCQPLLSTRGPLRRRRVTWQAVDAASDASTFGVAQPELEAFAARLERIAPRDPVLADGVAAWVAAIGRPRHVPAPSLCGELCRWRDTGFARAAEPVSPTATGLDEEVSSSPAIRLAGKRLRGLGVSRADQDRFEGGVLSLADYIRV